MAIYTCVETLLSVTSAVGLTTSEAGGTATFAVNLNSPPISPVTVVITPSDETEAMVTPATLVFDSANWNTTQTVTVTGVDDGEVDGRIDYTVTFCY